MSTHLPITLLAQGSTGGGGSALPGVLMTLGVLAVGLSVWWSLRKKLRHGFAQARESTDEKIHRVRSTATSGQRDRIETYMADAEELTRRLAAMLENKAERVETLIDRAERRIAELEGALADTPQITTRRVEPAGMSHSSPDSIRYEAADPIAVDVYRLADEGRSSVEIAKELDEHTGKIELILALRD